MNAARIKHALALVHMTERCSERPTGYPRAVAARIALASVILSDDERAILLSALHVSPDEVTS